MFLVEREMWRAGTGSFSWSFPLILSLACSITISQGSKPVQLDQGNFTNFIDKHVASHGILMEFYANWYGFFQIRDT
jgi:hypothetical protein